MSWLVSTLKDRCTTFCTHNAVKITFERRNILNEREITHNYRQNRTNDLRVCGLVSALDNACTTFCTHNAVKMSFKRRNILNGREITLTLRQNQIIIEICVCPGLFRRRKKRAPGSARITQCKGRLNVEISQTGEK